MTEATVADQPPAARCTAHPNVETYLRCGRCDTPICPRCMIMTPVGARCRGCARLKKLPMFDARPLDYLRGLIGGLAAASVGAVLLVAVPGLGFFRFLLMLLLGYAVGEATTRSANRKRGSGLAAVAALAVPVGLIVGQALFLVLVAGRSGIDVGSALAIAAVGLVVPLWDALLLLVAMGIAFSRVR